VPGLAPAHGLSLVDVIYQPEFLEAVQDLHDARR